MEKKKKTIIVDKKKFCEWYIDEDTRDGLGDNCVSGLIDEGEYHITLQDCLDDIGYLPLSMIINKEVIDKEDIDDYEIEEPCPKYKLKFAKWKKR